VWRRGSRTLRPFSEKLGVKARGSSRRLQRAMVDFGADEAFETAAAKMHEHYGIKLSVYRVRQSTLVHAARMDQQMPRPSRALPAEGPEVIVAEADGCMVPTVSFERAPEGEDRRKYRCSAWKEMRLVAARAKGAAHTHYAATMRGVECAADRWEHVVRAAGRGIKTHVHAVGDGADWIVQSCQHRFGPDADYLLDLFHVCDYLAAVWPAQRKMVRRHREHLKAGRLPKVLNALRRRLESPLTPETDAPARRALRYLQNRPDQLDYPAAIAAELPIGSGLIESGNRHVLQQRLKRAGAWWLTHNAHLMAQLRTVRANGHFDHYWSQN
jgi:hypothetical protein